MIYVSPTTSHVYAPILEYISRHDSMTKISQSTLNTVCVLLTRIGLHPFFLNPHYTNSLLVPHRE